MLSARVGVDPNNRTEYETLDKISVTKTSGILLIYPPGCGGQFPSWYCTMADLEVDHWCFACTTIAKFWFKSPKTMAIADPEGDPWSTSEMTPAMQTHHSCPQRGPSSFGGQMQMCKIHFLYWREWV